MYVPNVNMDRYYLNENFPMDDCETTWVRIPLR